MTQLLQKKSFISLNSSTQELLSKHIWRVPFLTICGFGQQLNFNSDWTMPSEMDFTPYGIFNFRKTHIWITNKETEEQSEVVQLWVFRSKSNIGKNVWEERGVYLQPCTTEHNFSYHINSVIFVIVILIITTILLIIMGALVTSWWHYLLWRKFLSSLPDGPDQINSTFPTVLRLQFKC